jgi:hypothetical protein
MKKTITSKQQSNGISFAGLLFILFLGLKLAGIGEVATWSWWWVTSPLWIGAAIVIGIAISVVIFFIIGSIFMTSIKLISKYLKTEPTGYLNINSIPVSKIVLDGKVLGNTPKKVKVTPGVHQVVFVDPDGVKFEKSVLVVAGETISVSHKL